MIVIRKLTCFFFLLLVCCYTNAQSSKVSVGKEPAWITKNNIDYTKTSLDKDAVDGYVDFDVERQILLADQVEYSRRSIKILSAAGVQNGSQVSVSFDPAYQQLIFHSIRIIRNGQILDRLNLSNIKTVHQEKELVNFIYNGSLDAILILDDVRQDDIIEYSYSIKGFNPIFKNKYADRFSTEFSFPVYQVFYKLIVPQGRTIWVRNLNEKLQPSITRINGQEIYQWQKANVASLVLQDYTPNWYDPYAQVLVTEFMSWKEVNDWALELFPVKKELSPALQKKISEIKEKYTTDDKRTSAALRFVQDDIRYMGIEMGENSHRPADPSKVFAQRFGDCKEKSYLLCCMLRSMNIDANPVLINSESKTTINDQVPAPTDFDHVTVRVRLDGKFYWFDPTISYQRGNVKNLFYPDYEEGLVISDSTIALTSIGFRNINYVHTKEYFKVADMSGEGTLNVVTSYEGDAADNIRSEFKNQSISKLTTDFQKFYAAYYEDIKADSLTYTDNDSTGLFITKEYYTIPDFWKVDKGKVSKFSFSAFVVNSILSRPKEKKRNMPFGLYYPARYREESIVYLPTSWKVTESEMHLKNNCFAFNSRFYCVDNKVYLQTDYENFKGTVSTDEAKKYFKDINEYDEGASFELTSGEDGSAKNSSPGIPVKDIFLTILVMVVIAGGLIWRSTRRR